MHCSDTHNTWSENTFYSTVHQSPHIGISGHLHYIERNTLTAHGKVNGRGSVGRCGVGELDEWGLLVGEGMGGGGCYMWAWRHTKIHISQLIAVHTMSQWLTSVSSSTSNAESTRQRKHLCMGKENNISILSCYKVYKFTKCTQNVTQKWIHRHPKGLDPTLVQVSTFFLTPDSLLHQSMTVSLHRYYHYTDHQTTAHWLTWEKKEEKRSHRDLNSDRWIQSPEC